MKLYCVRHGEAESADINPQRPLSANGRLEINKIAQHLASNRQIKIDHVIHSEKLRAVQTAEILAKALGIQNLTKGTTILDESAEVMPLVDMIKSWHDDTMLVGHLPFMYKLINVLTLNNEDYYPIINFVPGTIVCLENVEEHWMVNWIINPVII